MCCELQGLVNNFISPLDPSGLERETSYNWLKRACRRGFGHDGFVRVERPIWACSVQKRSPDPRDPPKVSLVIAKVLLSCTPHSCRPECTYRWLWCGFHRRSAASRLSAWRCAVGSKSRCSWRAAWARSWRRWEGPSGLCDCSGPRSAPVAQSGEDVGKQKVKKRIQGATNRLA